MSDPYAFARERVAAIIEIWKTGTVTLTRTIEAARDVETPWIPGAPTLAVYTLDAVVKGVDPMYIDGTTIVASDLMVIVAPTATLDGEQAAIVPQMDDVLAIDGAPKKVKSIISVLAAGVPARFNIITAS